MSLDKIAGDVIREIRYFVGLEKCELSLADNLRDDLGMDTEEIKALLAHLQSWFHVPTKLPYDLASRLDTVGDVVNTIRVLGGSF